MKLNLRRWLPAVAFLAGWLLAWGVHWSELYHVWALTAFVVTAVTLIHGSWIVVPAMLLSFLTAEACAWSYFFALAPYRPGGEELYAMSAFGCGVATLIGARSLIKREILVDRDASLAQIVSRACFVLASFAIGGYAYLFSRFAIVYFFPGGAATIAAAASGVTAWLTVVIYEDQKRGPIRNREHLPSG